MGGTGKMCQYMVGNFKSKGSRVHIEQKYGPLTSWHRNKALAVRKSLKAENKITKAYVAYPAKLMVCDDVKVKKVCSFLRLFKNTS